MSARPLRRATLWLIRELWPDGPQSLLSWETRRTGTAELVTILFDVTNAAAARRAAVAVGQAGSLAQVLVGRTTIESVTAAIRDSKLTVEARLSPRPRERELA